MEQVTTELKRDPKPETVKESTVLVIDDEIGPRESLRILLKNTYEVLLADHVDSGLDLLKEYKPDIVILDIRMPGKSGIEGLQELRKIDPVVSVVMLTGFGALDTARQAIQLGANDYLKKPFDTKEIMKVIQDNIDRTHLARKQAHVTEDLRNLNTELVNELTVKEHMACLGHASAEFVHDLRNPLTVVNGYVELLEEQLGGLKTRLGDESEEAFSYLNVIARNIQRCYEITEMWRNLGKEDGANREVVKLKELLTDVVRGVEPIATSTRAELVTDFTIDPGEARLDSLQVFRALQNLMTNAIQALPETGGSVRVVTGLEGDVVVIRIEDNGCGMPSDQLSKIFEPYYTTKELDKGTGLGLAITKKVIELHGGSINVESTEGEGTTFSVRLPNCHDVA
jgi:signal transduction histidine kinase